MIPTNRSIVMPIPLAPRIIPVRSTEEIRSRSRVAKRSSRRMNGSIRLRIASTRRLPSRVAVCTSTRLRDRAASATTGFDQSFTYARDCCSTSAANGPGASAARRRVWTGSVLFGGGPLKAEPPRRLALAGPNGAGKAAVGRALAGEVSIEGGEPALQKGPRIALHDQRPPAQSPRPLREYALSGTADLAAV